MENKDVAVALHQVKGIGTQILTEINRLVEGNWLTLIEDMRILQYLELTEELISQLACYLTIERIEKVKNELQEQGIQPIMLGEESYPKVLAEIYNPPFMLYGKGDLQLLNNPNSIGIVGTRTPSSYGQMVAHRLAGDLAEAGWVIISGLAIGIDSFAHRGALSVRGKTIAVLGCGINLVYPKQNSKLYEEISTSGLLLSEYPPDTQPTKGTFPQRNRIISGLSRGVIIVESHHRSGSLITATWALEQGREVFAVPGSILSAKSVGPHKLIKEGAKLITSAQDVLDEFIYSIQPELFNMSEHVLNDQANEEISEAEHLLLDLISYNQIHIDEIFRSALMPRGIIHQHLLALEMKKKIMKLPGYYYVKIR